MGAAISKMQVAVCNAHNNFMAKVQVVNQAETCDSQFLEIPVEIREIILSQLCPRDRQMLRVVCRQLANEIDTLIGPVNSINVNDSHQAKRHLAFFSKCCIPSVKVNAIGTDLNFNSTVMFPARLQSFTLNPEGITSVEFVSNVLENCVNLNNLHLGGKIQGLLHPLKLVPLPKLKSLSINLTRLTNVSNGRGFDSNKAMECWHNQMSLLRQIHAPKLEEASLFLYTFPNAPWKETAETELFAGVLKFLGHHKALQRLKLYHGERLVDPRFLEYTSPLSIFNKSYGLNGERGSGEDGRPQLYHPPTNLVPGSSNPGLRLNYFIKDFEFCSRLHPQFEDNERREPSEKRFEAHILSLLKSHRGLTHLKFSGSKGLSLSWSGFEPIISSNAETLSHFEIAGKIQGPITFEIFVPAESLAIIMINNNQRYRHTSLSPMIEQFGVVSSTILRQTLECLILQNVGIKREDIKCLVALKKLQHLALYRWRCGPGEETLTPDDIRTILSMSTLTSILIPWPRVWDFATAVDSLHELGVRLFRMGGSKCMSSFLHPQEGRKIGLSQYLCVQEEEEWEESLVEGWVEARKTRENKPRQFWQKTVWGFRMLDSFSY